ncbi:MAG: SDR family oxidoreductase [Rhodobacteraceae bacterium]|nr:SDR family oxidoreductase [Paracoccaceae bacterium]
MNSDFSMKGRTVLVAGGAGYLGMPVCESLRAAGATLCIADISEEHLAKAHDVLQALPGNGEVMTLPLDMGEEASILSGVESCARRLGPVHGLVMATAASSNTHLEKITVADFDRTNRVNLTGTFLLARATAQHMPGGSAMVLYASMYGLVSPDPANYPDDVPPNPVDYGASKAGIAQMARTLASHYAPRGIRVNAIAPGPFPPQAVQDANPEFIANLTRDTMLKRMGNRHETAGPVHFLLSDAASYVTGQTLSVDGGWTAW